MAKKRKLEDEDIVKALIYCKHRDGKLCDMCPYGKYAPDCSHMLLDAAADRIRELRKERGSYGEEEEAVDPGVHGVAV